MDSIAPGNCTSNTAEREKQKKKGERGLDLESQANKTREENLARRMKGKGKAWERTSGIILISVR
jgi:hypothetical protein